MSVTYDNKGIRCDSPAGCGATAALPVTLHPGWAPLAQWHATEGWLFVLDRYGWRHFCPVHASEMIRDLLDDAESPGNAGESDSEGDPPRHVLREHDDDGEAVSHDSGRIETLRPACRIDAARPSTAADLVPRPRLPRRRAS